MCSLLEVHTLGPTSTKYMPWAMRFTCQAVAVTGVLAYDVGGRCAHFQRGTATTGSFGAKIKIHRKLTQNPAWQRGGASMRTQRTDPVYRSISLQTYLAENEHSVALSHQRAPATARGHQEMDGQAAGQAPLRVDSTAAAFGGARRTRPPSRDAGRAHRGRATWALVPALRLAPCHWAVLSVCWVLGRSGGLSEIR